MTTIKQHDELVKMFYTMGEFRSKLSDMRWRNETIDDELFGDIDCSLTELEKDLVNAINANQYERQEFTNI